MEARWENGKNGQFETGETRTALVALGDGFVQEVEVEFIRVLSGGYSLYRTDPYMECLSEEAEGAIIHLVSKSTLLLAKFVSTRDDEMVPVA
jgi:hypothetical protein